MNNSEIPKKWTELYKTLFTNNFWKSKSYLAILKQVLEELGDAEQKKRQVETLNAELRYDRSKIEDDLIRLERDLENTREEIYGLKARLAVYGWSSALRDS